LDINTGKKIWTTNFPIKIDNNHRMILQNDYLICYGLASSYPNPIKSTLFILDKKSGIIINRHEYMKDLSSICADETGIYADHGLTLSAASIISQNILWDIKSP